MLRLKEYFLDQPNNRAQMKLTGENEKRPIWGTEIDQGAIPKWETQESPVMHTEIEGGQKGWQGGPGVGQLILDWRKWHQAWVMG